MIKSHFRIQDIPVTGIVFGIRIRINKEHQVPTIDKGIRFDICDAFRKLQCKQILTAVKGFALDFLQSFR